MQKTILVVDDDAELRKIIKDVLTTNNFNVVEAEDGAKALELVEKFIPDLVILDFAVPKVSGETVCVKIKQDHPNIIVFALTDSHNKSDIVHGLQIGADDYMTKPFASEELIARIDARLKSAPVDHPAKQIVSQSKSSNGVVVPPPETSAPPPQNEFEDKKIIFRESAVLIAIKLICAELLFAVSFALVVMFISLITPFLVIPNTLVLYFILFGTLLVFNAVVIGVLILKWHHEYAEVSKQAVSIHSGILHKKEQKYACNFVEAVSLEQSFLGMLFNYGTIELYDPALKEKVYLTNISSPKKSSKIVEGIIAKDHQEKEIPFVAA